MANAIVDGSMSVIFNRSNWMVGGSGNVGPSPQSASKVFRKPTKISVSKVIKQKKKTQEAKHTTLLHVS